MAGAHEGRAVSPDASLAGPANVVIGLLAGRLTVAQARSRGLRASGNLAALKRLRPAAA